MQSVEEFLAYAVKLEEEAALRFGELADAMQSCGNRDVGKLFRRLSDYSRLHLADAKARTGYRDIPDLKPGEFDWPDFESPESGRDLGRRSLYRPRTGARNCARRRTGEFLIITGGFSIPADPEIRVLAKEFAEEETGHVAEIEKWIVAHKLGAPLPVDR